VLEATLNGPWRVPAPGVSLTRGLDRDHRRNDVTGGTARHFSRRYGAAAAVQGLTRNRGPASGLAEDFTLTAGDIPAKADPGEPGRDIPAEILRRLCGQLPELEHVVSSRETRVAVELLMDTGRRPAEICGLEWDCLARAADGTPVLVYDNAKAHQGSRPPSTGSMSGPAPTPPPPPRR